LLQRRNYILPGRFFTKKPETKKKIADFSAIRYKHASHEPRVETTRGFLFQQKKPVPVPPEGGIFKGPGEEPALRGPA
jgi:hypothetical protein